MFDLQLRPAKDKALHGLATALGRHVPAGALTAASLILSLAAAAAAWAGLPPVAVASWLLGRLADGLDGPVARARGEANDLGGYLDMLADTVGYAVIPLGVGFGVDERGTWIALSVLLASFFVNAVSWAYLAAILEKRGTGAAERGELTSVTMPPAMVEGTETIVLYTLFLAIPAWSALLFGLMAALVGVNVTQRLAWAARALGDDAGNPGA
jgi:phosphatidylglycerophosphate synthase